MSQSTETAALISRFDEQASVLHDWSRDLTRAELVARPVAGAWSVQELIVHMLESDLAATHRMRRIAAEDLPLLIAYDETACAAKLHYQTADLAVVTDLFRLNRTFTAAWLRTVPDSDFTRCGIHNQRGKVSLREMVGLYVHHVKHHLPFLIEKRSVLGKPLV